MRSLKASRTDSTAHGIAPTWIGTCSACAISRAWASQSAVEKSRLELRICEYAVRSMASPISWTIASRRCVSTDTVTGSVTLPDLRDQRVAVNHESGRGGGARGSRRPRGTRALLHCGWAPSRRFTPAAAGRERVAATPSHLPHGRTHRCAERLRSWGATRSRVRRRRSGSLGGVGEGGDGEGDQVLELQEVEGLGNV